MPQTITRSAAVAENADHTVYVITRELHTSIKMDLRLRNRNKQLRRMFLIYSPDDSNVCGARDGEFEGILLVWGLKVMKSCSQGSTSYSVVQTLLL